VTADNQSVACENRRPARPTREARKHENRDPHHPGSLAVSLISAAIVEAIASAFKWRANTLLSGIKNLLNDQDFRGLARDLYAHASINPRGPGVTEPTKDKPTYIDNEQFANALMDITGLSCAIVAAGSPAAPPAAHFVPPANLRDAVDKKTSGGSGQNIRCCC
jgi:hypothetical protein